MSSVMPAGTASPPAQGFVAGWLSNIEASGRSPVKAIAGFCIAWAALFVILHVMPTPHGLQPAGQATLAVMTWACVMWISEAVPVGVSGLLIPMLLVLTNAVKPFPAAASGFVMPVVFLCLAAFIFAAIMQVAGLDRRLALSLLHRFRATTVNGVIWSMFVVNILLSFIIPAANARAATLLPVINGITRFFGDTERERNAKKAIVIQSLVYGSMISGMCILTAHLPNYIIVSLVGKQGYGISYWQWFTLQWPYLGMFVLTQWWVKHYFRTRGVTAQGGARAIEQQYREMPRMRQSEWLILAAFALVALLWAFEKQIGIASHNAALIGLAALFVPGLFAFKWKEIQERTIWGTLLLLAGALSLSDAMGKTGLAQWLADLLHPVTSGQPWWVVVGILMVGTRRGNRDARTDPDRDGAGRGSPSGVVHDARCRYRHVRVHPPDADHGRGDCLFERHVLDDRLRESRMDLRIDRDRLRPVRDGALVCLHGRAGLGSKRAVAVRQDRPPPQVTTGMPQC
jgi:solute carrier family 13 (sodium-dependent dicarboxylate transporter), member 2/3/5